MMAVARPALLGRRHRAGAAWRAKYRSLPPEEQADILVKMIFGHLAAVARRRGEPEPTFLRQMPDGSFEPWKPRNGGAATKLPAG
jgi:hypothetical protein